VVITDEVARLRSIVQETAREQALPHLAEPVPSLPRRAAVPGRRLSR
jgi:hypothetical protein